VSLIYDYSWVVPPETVVVATVSSVENVYGICYMFIPCASIELMLAKYLIMKD